MVKYRLAGIGGSSALARICSGMVRGFDHCLQFLAGVKRHDPSGGNGNLLARFGIAARTLRLFAKLEVAEPRELHAVAHFERHANLLEKTFDHVLRFTLVEAELLEEQVGEFGFGERHRKSYWRSVPPNRSAMSRSIPATVSLISASVKLRAVSC